MHATRLLKSSANNVSKGYLIPPRGTFDILGSAFSGTVSLLMSQEKRDEFVEAINKGTIRPDILGNSSFGLSMTVGLYNELENPVLQQHGFKAEDFLEGVKPALQNFHNLQGNIRNEFHEIEEQEEGGGEGPKEGKKTTEGNDEGQKKENDDDVAIFDAMQEDQRRALEAAFASVEQDFQKNIGSVDQVVNWNWTKEAADNEESLLAHLKRMVTPEFFESIQSNSKQNYLLELLMGRSFSYEDESTEVNSVALLSARTAYYVDPEEEKNDDVSEVAEDELNVGEAAEGPVVAQVEVLYDMKQTLLTQARRDSDKEMDEEELNRSFVYVGVLEGWLRGDPEGHKEVRWRLADIRTPWEFPSLETY